jgi:hypothetical protein
MPTRKPSGRGAGWDRAFDEELTHKIRYGNAIFSPQKEGDTTPPFIVVKPYEGFKTNSVYDGKPIVDWTRDVVFAAIELSRRFNGAPVGMALNWFVNCGSQICIVDQGQKTEVIMDDLASSLYGDRKARVRLASCGRHSLS